MSFDDQAYLDIVVNCGTNPDNVLCLKGVCDTDCDRDWSEYPISVAGYTGRSSDYKNFVKCFLGLTTPKGSHAGCINIYVWEDDAAYPEAFSQVNAKNLDWIKSFCIEKCPASDLVNMFEHLFKFGIKIGKRQMAENFVSKMVDKDIWKYPT